MSYCTLMDHGCGPGLIGHLKHCTSSGRTHGLERFCKLGNFALVIDRQVGGSRAQRSFGSLLTVLESLTPRLVRAGTGAYLQCLCTASRHTAAAVPVYPAYGLRELGLGRVC